MTVFMFPGQGAQKPGMGADLLGIAEVAQTFAIAGEVCGVDVAALAREGNAEQVNDAYNAQVLAAALSVGLSHALEMTRSAAPRGLAELQAVRRGTATEAHRRLASDCNGHGKWQALAGGGYWRGAGGQAPLSKGQAVERRSRGAVARAGAPCAGASPPEGGKIRAPCMI